MSELRSYGSQTPPSPMQCGHMQISKQVKLWMYPRALDDCTYTPQDLDMFIRECIHIGIINLHELSKYYRQFLLITQYLVSKNWMVPSEQSHAFFRRFCSDFANHILQWLQLKQLDHLPINPCDLANIYKATTFVLMGTGYTQLSMTQPTMNFENMTHSGPILTPLQPNKTMIKIEALTAAIANLTEMFKSMMERGGGRPRNAAPHPAGASRSTGNFCRGARHFIWECKVITEYN